MASTHQGQRRETHDEAICRLAGEAERRSVQVYRTPDGRHWATSISQPGDLYFVTGYSCTCKGFTHHHRCTHHAALLAHMGWLPASPTPPAPATARVPEVPCDRCDGHGWGYAATGTWTCHTCSGTGVAPDTLIAA